MKTPHRPYLSRPVVAAAIQAARARGVSSVATSRRGFGPAYLEFTDSELHRYGPAAYPGQTWAQRRDAFVARHMAQVERRGEVLWDSRGRPSRRHLALAVWAYSPDPVQLRRWLRASGYLPRP